MESVGIFSQSNPNYDRNIALALTSASAAFTFIAVSMGMRFGLHNTLGTSLLAGGIAILPSTVSGVIAAKLFEAKEEEKKETIAIVIEEEASFTSFVIGKNLSEMNLEALHSHFYEQSHYFGLGDVDSVISIAGEENDAERKVAILAGYLAGAAEADKTGYISITLRSIAQETNQEVRAKMLVGALYVLKRDPRPAHQAV